jgi:hypothetical protein
MWEVGCGRNPIVTRLALRNQLRITNEDELPQEQFLSDVGFSHVPHLTCPLTGRDKKKRTAPETKFQGQFKGCRRRPTLPRSLERSTIGAVGLNYRVRNGNGCGPYAPVASEMVTTEET